MDTRIAAAHRRWIGYVLAWLDSLTGDSWEGTSRDLAAVLEPYMPSYLSAPPNAAKAIRDIADALAGWQMTERRTARERLIRFSRRN